MSEIGMFFSRILTRLFCLNPWKDYSHEKTYSRLVET